MQDSAKKHKNKFNELLASPDSGSFRARSILFTAQGISNLFYMKFGLTTVRKFEWKWRKAQIFRKDFVHHYLNPLLNVYVKQLLDKLC